MIYINDIPSLRNPETISYTFDDRTQKIPLINGNTVQDYGYIPTGDVISLSCVFSVANFQRLQQLWVNRTKVSFTDTAGVVWQDMRIVLKSFKRDEHFKNYVTLEFELWRV